MHGLKVPFLAIFSEIGWMGHASKMAHRIFFLFYVLIFICFFNYETVVSRNGLSLGYSEGDTISVRIKPYYPFRRGVTLYALLILPMGIICFDYIGDALKS